MKNIINFIALALCQAFIGLADLLRPRTLAMSNVDETIATDQNVGVHENALSGLYVDSGISNGEKYRHLLYTMGSDSQHVVVCGAFDIPLGTIDNMNVATTDRVTLLLWNRAQTTRKCVASAAITLNTNGVTPVYMAAAGQIAATGSVLIGFALNAAAAQYGIVEVIPVTPIGGKRAIFAGTHTTAGGSATETKTLTGLLSTDIVIVSLRQKGATPRTILTAAPTADTLTMVFSGDPSTDHKVDYMVLR
jgi:hypothetical protein